MSTFTDSLAQPGGKLQAAIIRNPLTISLESNLFQVVELMNAARSHDQGLHRLNLAEENLNSARASCVVVIENDQIAGIITEHDIVKLSLQQIPLTNISVQSCLTRPVLSILESELTDIFLAINLLQFHHIQQIPVLDKRDKLVGLITQESVNYFAQSAHLLKQRTASEVMKTEIAQLSPSVTLLQVAQVMVDKKTSTVILIEEKGRTSKVSTPVGILTERDLVQFQALGLNFAHKCAWEVMSQPVICVSSDTSLWDTQRVMEQKYIKRILVTGDRNVLKGLITQENLVYALSPTELYKLTERQGKQILKLEQEKTRLLIDRARDLDKKVQERTRELFDQDESYETLSHQTPAGIFRTNLEGKCTYANHEWCNITGIDPNQIHGVDWLELACPQHAQMLLKEWVLCLQSNRPFVLDFQVQNRQGHTHWVICRIIPEINSQGEVKSYLGCFTAINELKLKEDVIRHHSLHDPLTQLPNRRLLKKRLEEAIEKLQGNKNHGYGILFLDLDQFKSINDQLGHWVGDRLLQQIAQVLKSHVRNKDLVAHMGGDEFLILLEGLKDEHKIIQIAKRILQDCQQTFPVGDYELLTGVSMGIVVGQTIYKNPADLIRHAEIALAKAKKAGGNQYKLFDFKLHQDMLQRSTLEKDLRRAITEEQFILHYQPIVSLRGGDLLGFEALARWIHPDKGVIPPSEFIPIAEDMGLLVALDRYVFRKACEQLHSWQLQFRNCNNLKLNFNLSAQTLLSPKFIHDIKRILLAIGLSNQAISFDIREKDTLARFSHVQPILGLLKENEFNLCMDDFGTGYSALGHLQKLPMDAVKIDSSLVSNMHLNNDIYQMVSTLVALCSQLGITAIAEGVETPEQLLWLQKLGCEQGQGFFFARPLPPPDIEVRFLQKLHQKS